MLWCMAFGQAVLLAFFLCNGVQHWWWDNGLLGLCFVVGLFGGAVYVNTMTLVAEQVAPRLAEFSLAAISVGESIGIASADAVAVVIQGCLYAANNLPGATFSCS